MTDFLEEALENAGALLEQIRRLERGWAGPVSEGGVGGRASDSPASVRETLWGEVHSRIPKNKRGDEWTAEETGGGSSAVYSERTEVDNLEIPSGVTRGTRAEDTVEFEKDEGGLNPPRQSLAPLEERRERVPALLAELERLERADGVVSPAGPSARSAPRAVDGQAVRTAVQMKFPAEFPRAGGLRPDLGLAPEENWTAGQAFEKPGRQAVDELRWAEWADRVFRRDSRRYDGGFYLY